MKEKTKFRFIGLVSGLFNGMFGAGGGMLLVLLLEKVGIKPKNAHATSIAIIAAISVLSVVIYFACGHINLKDSLFYIPTGILGAFIGGFLLKNIKKDIIRRIFGIIMIISGIRLFFK
ncbi:MAG: sulfite exporter TauE/SafE family protein [Oscillospiraceae bacterium]|nr:sulfite exporter TauE/SafE family protein [Oscillospiraceae bacterium]